MSLIRSMARLIHKKEPSALAKRLSITIVRSSPFGRMVATATDMETGEPFNFDAGALYGHNEYDVGNWRPLSSRVYERN